MAIKVVAAPTVEPVALAEAKAHLRVLHADDNAYIGALIAAAREACEQECERAIATQTIRLTLDEFPSGAIQLPRPSATSIVSVKYLDSTGALITANPATYWLDDANELASWAMPTTSWPGAGGYANAVQVEYISGWETVPAAVKQWILLMIGEMYENREASAERALTERHRFFDHLIDRYRIPGV